MKRPQSLNAVPARRALACALALACAALLPAQASAEEYPPLRPGLWKFTRATTDTTGAHRQTRFTRQRCADPTADMRARDDELSREDCTVTRPFRRGEGAAGIVYESAAVCTVFGVRMESRTRLIKADSGTYEVSVATSGTHGATTEDISAVRLGDCRKE